MATSEHCRSQGCFASQLASPELARNSGLMAVDAGYGMLANTNDNANGEYYLTDIVALARSQGRTCAVVEGVELNLWVSTRAPNWLRRCVIQQGFGTAMAAGTSMHDPASVYLSGHRNGQDVTLGQCVFGPGVTIADNVRIEHSAHGSSSVRKGAIVDQPVGAGVILAQLLREHLVEIKCGVSASAKLII